MKTIIALTCLAAGCQLSHEENLGYSAAGTPRWAVTLGDRQNDAFMGVAVDSLGDVVAGGSLVERDPADNDHLIEHGFITKRVASDGAERWTRTFVNASSRSFAHLSDVAVGPQDTLYAVGMYAGTVDFGGQTLTLPPDKAGAFVAAISATGSLLWVRGLGDLSQGLSVAVDPEGRVFVVGRFVSSSIQIGSQVFVEADNDSDVFLAAFDPDGNVLWGTAFQGSAPGTIAGAGPSASGLAVAGNGDILVAGTFSAPLSFGGAVLDPQARSRGFFARYRNDGLYLASETIGPPAPYTTVDAAIAVDATGHLVFQQIEQDDRVPSGPDQRHTTLRVLADNGTELWNTRLENHSIYGPEVRALATTQSGLIVTSAWTDGPYNADDRASATGSMEVLAFDGNGSPGMSSFGARHFAALQPTMTRDMAVAPSGALVFVGTFGGRIDFGTGTIADTHGQDDADAFIVLVDPPSDP